MEGIRICFPLTGQEEKSEAMKDLFSLNLDMGPAGRARLVVSHVDQVINDRSESNICVKLSVTNEYLGAPLSLKVSKFVLNSDGSLHCKVILYSHRIQNRDYSICLV